MTSDINYGEGATMYFDKHGTEIHLGDIVLCHCDSSSCNPGDEFAAKLLERPENYRKHMEVIRRADGSPVFRYADWQDVRDGDIYAHADGRQQTAHSISAWHTSAWRWTKDGEPSDGVTVMRTCTLIRRARESERPARDFGPVPPGVYEWLCSCGQYSVRNDRPIERARCTECGCWFSAKEEPTSRALIAQRPELVASPTPYLDRIKGPILGHDRNGKEVRKGDTVKNATTSRVVHHRGKVAGINDDHAFFSDCHDGGIFESEAELVEEGSLIIKSTGTTAKTLELPPIDGASSPFAGAGHALESLCRFLAQPTRAQFSAREYAWFRAAVQEAASGQPTFSVVTDRTATELVAWIMVPLAGEERFAVPLGFDELPLLTKAEMWVSDLAELVMALAGAVAMGKPEVVEEYRTEKAARWKVER